MPGHVFQYEVFPYGSTVVNYRWPAWSVLPALKRCSLWKNFRTPVELLILKCLPIQPDDSISLLDSVSNPLNQCLMVFISTGILTWRLGFLLRSALQVQGNCGWIVTSSTVCLPPNPSILRPPVASVFPVASRKHSRQSAKVDAKLKWVYSAFNTLRRLHWSLVYHSQCRKRLTIVRTSAYLTNRLPCLLCQVSYDPREPSIVFCSDVMKRKSLHNLSI